MSAVSPCVNIGILNTDPTAPCAHRGWGIWSPGYPAAVTASGGVPVELPPRPPRSWADTLQGIHGVVFAGADRPGPHAALEEEGLLAHCRQQRLPLLAIDRGLLALNTAFGGSNYLDLARELPEALQHRHPPEQGVRHAMTVEHGTELARLYGEGEIVVNSEHRRAVCRVARGFRVSARRWTASSRRWRRRTAGLRWRCSGSRRRRRRRGWTFSCSAVWWTRRRGSQCGRSRLASRQRAPRCGRGAGWRWRVDRTLKRIAVRCSGLG